MSSRRTRKHTNKTAVWFDVKLREAYRISIRNAAFHNCGRGLLSLPYHARSVPMVIVNGFTGAERRLYVRMDRRSQARFSLLTQSVSPMRALAEDVAGNLLQRDRSNSTRCP
jgi:hypothetical protein